MAWLKANGVASDAFIYKRLAANSSGIKDIFVQFDVYICPSLIATNGSQDFYDLFDLYNAGGASYPVSDPTTFTLYDMEGLGASWTGGNPTTGLWETESNGQLAGPIAAGSHTIGVHIRRIATRKYEYKIDGVTTTLPNADLTGWVDQLDVLAIGALFAGSPSRVSWITNVKVGTSAYGSTEILSDDFSSGNFSLWDGTVGDVSIAGSVTCGATPAPGGVVFRAIHAAESVGYGLTPVNHSGSGVVLGCDFRTDDD